jgi:putative transposase
MNASHSNNKETKKYFKNYRWSTFRASWWDYGSNGAYFITINLQWRKHHFGHIERGVMHLSALGKIAEEVWYQMPQHYPFAKLGAFVVMPDHIHGIVIIDHASDEEKAASVDQYIAENPNHELTSHRKDEDYDFSTLEELFASNDIEDTDHCSSSHRHVLLKKKQGERGGVTGEHNPMLRENLGRLIRWYKGRTTFECRKLNRSFKWQSLYYDVIIPDKNAYHAIERYIQRNPLNWKSRK